MLNGWKTIAAYLRRNERTAMRWAAERGLPVHHLPGRGRGSVYALAEEIDEWLAANRDLAAAAAQSPSTAIVSVTPLAVSRSPVAWLRHRWAASALTVSGALLVALGAVTLYRPAQSSTLEPVFTDPVAKALFLQASYDWNLRTRASLARAAREYSEAIGRDPRVPAAYVGLANSYLLLREFGSMPDADAYPRAEAAAHAALALAPDAADAHRALAFIAFWWRQDRVTARHEFARAIALKPDDPLTHQWFATALLANGESEAALREISKARDLDPSSTAVLADEGLILYVAGRRADGLDLLRRLIREQPDAVGPHRYLAEIALSEGRVGEYLNESAQMARLRGDEAGLAQIARWRSTGMGANELATAMLRDARQVRGGLFRVARLAGLSGRRDEAKDALARACANHEPATIIAPSDIWLAHSLSPADIAARCPQISLL